ncbi:putative leader peptide [Antrihabitans spumae]|uniref:Leader peptide n=1 Tax=Antrihabitans spumae TaxID=3373370 RepID=A0ABW7K8D9_9NOCA
MATRVWRRLHVDLCRTSTSICS